MTVEWKTLGSCVDHSGLDWDEEADDAAAAECLQICATCPVRGQCLTEALKQGEEGIWGGTTHQQRQALAKADGIKIPRQIRHGTRTTYTTHRCTCNDCRTAHRDYTRAYRAAQLRRRQWCELYSTPIVLLRRRGRARPGQYLLPLGLPTIQDQQQLAA